MKNGSRLGLWGLALVVSLVAFPGCSVLATRPPERPKAKAEVIFVEPGHAIASCAHGALAKTHLDLPDSVLFFDRDSKIRVTPPTKKGAVPYHVHLIHGTRSLDFVAHQDSKGLIELDLSRFDQPEEIIVVSAGRRIVEDQDGAVRAASDRDERREEIVTPPYVLSFKLIPAEGQMETILSLQRHRWEVQTEAGKLHLVTGSPNRRDHLLTWFDPAKAHFQLVSEDPYVYIPAQDGATPPRLTVEVVSAGPGGRPWQRAATYHMPDGIDRIVKAGEKPFLFRTKKRDIISFTPAPRVDLVLPKDPAATSALVQVAPGGLTERDVFKVVLACVYPSGTKGDSAAWVKTESLAGSRPENFTVDLGHLNAAAFPLTSSLTLRSVLPWKLTSGRYVPEPPLGKASVSLAAPSGPPTTYSKFLTPKYASHYDFLRFLGAGNTAGGSSSLLDDYFGRGPDDPNVTPPPTVTPPPGPFPPVGIPGPGPGGGGTGTPPGPGTAHQAGGAGGGLGGGLGGGQNSNCGCGQNGNNCPNAAAKCRGTCGQGCPANGCCDPGGNINGGGFLVKKPCPPKGKSCGKSEKECKCHPHQWTREEIRAAVMAAIMANPNLRERFADLDGPNAPAGFAPCHTETHVADVVAHFWKGNAVGINAPGPGQFHVTYHISVVFKPCRPIEGGGPGVVNPVEPGTIKPEPDSSGTSGALAINTGATGGTGSSIGATFTLDLIDPENPISTSLNPTSDPNTLIDVSQATNALNGGTANTGDSTIVVPADIIRADVETLLAIRSAWDARMNAVSMTWLLRPAAVQNRPDSWTLSLPNAQWGVPLQQTTAGGGTTTPPTTTPPTTITPPPPTAPPPPTPPPPPPPSTKPTKT